jgi:hypothetical protein
MRDLTKRVRSPGTGTIRAQVTVIAELHCGRDVRDEICDAGEEIRDVSEEIKDVRNKGTKRTLVLPRLPLESKAVGTRSTGALRGT